MFETETVLKDSKSTNFVRVERCPDCNVKLLIMKHSDFIDSKCLTVHFGRICLRCRMMYLNPKFAFYKFAIEFNKSLFHSRSKKKPCTFCGHRVIQIKVDRYDSEKGHKSSMIGKLCRDCNTVYLRTVVKECVMVVNRRYGR